MISTLIDLDNFQIGTSELCESLTFFIVQLKVVLITQQTFY